MLNKVLLIGNLTDDPRELRTTQSGQTVTDFRIAVNDGWGDNERTLFIDVTVWGRTAENCAKYLRKGRGVFVEGRLEEDKWEDKTTGQPRSKVRVVATNVQFMPDRTGGGGSGGGGGGARSDDDPARGFREREDRGGSRGSGNRETADRGPSDRSSGSTDRSRPGGTSGGGSSLKDYNLDDEGGGVPF